MAKQASARAEAPAGVVDGVRMAMVRPKVLEAGLREAGLLEALALPLEGRVNALQQRNRTATDREKAMECAKCGGISDERLDACPFCGDSEEAPAEQAADLDEERVAEVITAVKSKALATKGEGERLLDRQVEDVRELKAGAAVSYWKLGAKIREIFDQQSWRARTTNGGKAAYTSFEQLCVREVRMASGTCYMLMDISKNFTEDQVRAFGTTKLGLVLRAPAPDQPKLLEQVAGGASKRDLAQLVADAKEKRGQKKRETGRKAMPEGRPGKVAKPRADGRVTVSIVEGAVRLDMYVKPDKKLQPGQLPEKKAKQFGDAPFAVEEMQNGVTRYYSVLRAPDGHLVLKIETKRAEPKA